MQNKLRSLEKLFKLWEVCTIYETEWFSSRSRRFLNFFTSGWKVENCDFVHSFWVWNKNKNASRNESTFKLGQIDQEIVLIFRTNCKSVLKMAITHTKHSICRLLSGFYCNLATPLLIYEVLQTNCSTVTKLPHNGLNSIMKYILWFPLTQTSLTNFFVMFVE